MGNHTYHHYDMSKLSDEASFNQELTSLETLYRETTGEDMPRYYRPPQGIYSEKNLEMAQGRALLRLRLSKKLLSRKFRRER